MAVTFNASMNGTDEVASLLHECYGIIGSLGHEFGRLTQGAPDSFRSFPYPQLHHAMCS